MRYLLLVFALLIPVNFVGMVGCKKQDERYWLFALVMSIMGILIILLRLMGA